MKIELSLDEFHTISQAGLQLNDIYVLKLIEDEVKWESFHLAWVLRMSMGRLGAKGYLVEGKLTDKARMMLASLNLQGSTIKQEDEISNFARSVHSELVAKLLQLTGKKQKVVGGKYSFLCNRIDLEKKLRDVFKKYGELSLEKIRASLLRHVEKSHKAGWDRVYLIEYFIMKEGVSRMVTDLENDEPETNEEMRPLVDPKSMF